MISAFIRRSRRISHSLPAKSCNRTQSIASAGGSATAGSASRTGTATASLPPVVSRVFAEPTSRAPVIGSPEVAAPASTRPATSSAEPSAAAGRNPSGAGTTRTSVTLSVTPGARSCAATSMGRVGPSLAGAGRTASATESRTRVAAISLRRANARGQPRLPRT